MPTNSTPPRRPPAAPRPGRPAREPAATGPGDRSGSGPGRPSRSADPTSRGDLGRHHGRDRLRVQREQLPQRGGVVDRWPSRPPAPGPARSAACSSFSTTRRMLAGSPRARDRPGRAAGVEPAHLGGRPPRRPSSATRRRSGPPGPRGAGRGSLPPRTAPARGRLDLRGAGDVGLSADQTVEVDQADVRVRRPPRRRRPAAPGRPRRRPVFRPGPPVVIISSRAPVQVTTTSVSAEAAGRSSKRTARPPRRRPAVRPGRGCGSRRSPAPRPPRLSGPPGRPSHRRRPPAPDGRPGPAFGDSSSYAALTSERPAEPIAGLGLHPLADPDRLLEQGIEHRADGAVALAWVSADFGPGRGSGSPRRPSSPARRRPRRCARPHPRRRRPRHGPQLATDRPANRASASDRIVQGAVEPGHRRIQLGAVAGGQHHRLVDVFGADQLRRRAWPRPARPSRAGPGNRPTSVLCDTLTHQDAHRAVLLTPASRGRPSLALALLVVGEDLQLLAEVDLADVDPLRHDQHRRGEVEDAGDPEVDEPVGDRLGASAGVAITAIAAPVSATSPRARSRSAMARPWIRWPIRSGDGSIKRDDAEAAGVEAGVVGQRRAEVAEADDDHRPVVGRPDLAADLEPQVLDVVADTAGAVRAEVGEVLAELGRVDPGRLGQRAAADRVDAALGELVSARR